MDFFKRLGTDRHKFKVQFFLKTMSCNAKLKGDVYISIKRGEHKISSQKKISFQQNGTCDFAKQILTFQSLTLFFDPQKKQYQEKQGQVRAIVVTQKGQKKLLGSFQIDIAEYANAGKENISVKKQFGDKIKAVLEFDVFIKCMGQASQTSKSVDKQIQRKKQSSLSKFASFFTGKQSPDQKSKQKNKQKDDEEDSQDSTKQVKNYKKQGQRQVSNPKNSAKDAEKVFKNKYDIKGNKKQDKNEKQPKEVQKKQKDQPGSQRKIPDKPKKKKDEQQQEQQEDTPPRAQKNLVNVRRKDNLTQFEQSQSDPKVKLATLKKNSTPVQQPLFFDDYKKNQEDHDNSSQFDSNKHKMKRTQKPGTATTSKQTNINDKKQQPTKLDNKKLNQIPVTKPYQSGPSNTVQIQNLNKVVKDLKDKNTTLQKQNKQLKSENKRLNQDIQSLKQKVDTLERQKSALQAQSRDFYQTQRDGTNRKGDDERVRGLQRQKGELLVKVQKLQQKYKKDFQKYQQKVQQLQQQKTQLQQASKAQIKRLKQQYSQLKDKYDKLMQKYEQKINESKDTKQKQNDLKQRLAIAQNNLSQLKLKIGDKLNQANQQGNKSIIDILTLLSQ